MKESFDELQKLISQALNAPRESGLMPLNPEYSTYTTTQVISELRDNSTNAAQRQKLDEALRQVVVIGNLRIDFRQPLFEDSTSPEANVLQGELKKLWLLRFGDNKKICPPNCQPAPEG